MKGALYHFGTANPPLDPHALAGQILAEGRFRVRIGAPAHRAWWQSFFDWMHDRWLALADAFAHHVLLNSHTSIAVGDVALAAVLVLVLVIGFRLINGAVRDTQSAPLRYQPIGAAADAQGLYEESQRAAQAASFERAVSLLFAATLATLDVHGVVRDEPSRTVNEWRRAVRTRVPELSPAFDAVARAFTAANYAQQQVGETQWRAARDAFLRMPRRDDAA